MQCWKCDSESVGCGKEPDAWRVWNLGVLCHASSPPIWKFAKKQKGAYMEENGPFPRSIKGRGKTSLVYIFFLFLSLVSLQVV